MKAGLSTSVVLHVAVLGFGLVSLSAPAAFDVADVESLPVDIIPIESMTQIQQGDKKATMSEKPAPLPTTKPETVPDAQKVGENEVDTEKPPTPDAKPKPVETAKAASAPEPSPKPAVKPDPEPIKEPPPKPEPVPATEVKPEPAPKQEVKPDPAPEATPEPVPTETAEAVALPTAAPAPEARPKPPQAQTAKAPDRKDSEKPTKKAAEKPKADEKEFNTEDIAALLNKEKAAGGGAKRSTETASLGGDKKTTGNTLSQSEMDALRGQIQRCWNVPSGALDAENLRVSIQFRLDPSGAIEGAPQIVSGGGAAGIERAAAESARRAVLKCAPYNLPADKYDSWAEVVVNFDPTEMF